MAASAEYMRRYMRERYHERRKRAITQLGGSCVRCGSRSELEFDHIDPMDKSFSISKMWSLSKSKFDQELAKCQLLCRSCHREKTRNDPDTYPQHITECCGKRWTGRQYAGHRRHCRLGVIR